MAPHTKTPNPSKCKPLTVERLREVLHYDPETGAFIWTVQKGSKGLRGSVAGSFHDSGHRVIRIDWRIYYAHRLAWLYMTGEWPPAEIDHRNGVRDDNRWCNLRAAFHCENGRNGKLRSTNTSGFKGVIFDKERQRWRAEITVNGRNHHLGRFETAEAAASAYQAAAVKLHGEFARLT